MTTVPVEVGRKTTERCGLSPCLEIHCGQFIGGRGVGVGIQIETEEKGQKLLTG